MQWSEWTLVDFIFAAIILFSTGFALIKGFAREIIRLSALIGGFFLASFYYPVVSGWLTGIVSTEVAAGLISFIAIFISSLLIGAVVMFFINRFLKMTSLQWIDRLLGAVFGLVRGWAVASIMALALVAFPVYQDTMARSRFAPYLLAGARAAVLLVPQELKDKFNIHYQEILKTWNQDRSSA